MEWVEWANWFSFGKYLNKEMYQFDREHIKHDLDVGLHEVKYCPHIRKNLIEAVFSLIPDQVQVSEKGGWKYKENYQETPNSIKIVKVDKYDGYTSTHEFFTDGVAPIGFEVAKSILRRAFEKCGITDIDIMAVLP